MRLSSVMDEIGARLNLIADLNVYPFPADTVTVPAAIVFWPDLIEYDQTFGRGDDDITLHVFAVVGRTSDKAARDNLTKYADGSGPSSFKQAIEAPGPGQSFGLAAVTEVDFGEYQSSGVSYLAAHFTVEITGIGN